MRKHLWYFSLFRFSPSFWQDLQVFSIKKLNISRFQFFYVDRSVSDQIKFTQISELCDIACNCSHKKRKKKVFPFLVTMLQQFSMSHLYWLCLSCVFFGKWSSNSSQYWLDVLGYCISSPQLWHIHQYFFNRDLNCGCLVYMFSLRFSRSKFLINLRRQFRLHKIFIYKFLRNLLSFHFVFNFFFRKC